MLRVMREELMPLHPILLTMPSSTTGPLAFILQLSGCECTHSPNHSDTLRFVQSQGCFEHQEEHRVHASVELDNTYLQDCGYRCH
jgi:hypothetical protein